MNSPQNGAAYKSFLIKVSATTQPGIAVVIATALFDIIGTAACACSILILAGPYLLSNEIAAVTWTVHTILWQAGMNMMGIARFMGLIHRTTGYLSSDTTENPFGKGANASKAAEALNSKIT
jgi:hypothetical protein